MHTCTDMYMCMRGSNSDCPLWHPQREALCQVDGCRVKHSKHSLRVRIGVLERVAILGKLMTPSAPAPSRWIATEMRRFTKSKKEDIQMAPAASGSAHAGAISCSFKLQ